MFLEESDHHSSSDISPEQAPKAAENAAHFFEEHREAIPLLAAPPTATEKPSRKHLHVLWMGFVSVVLMAATVVWGAHQREWLANLTISDLQMQSSSRMIAVADAQEELKNRNDHPITVVVKSRGNDGPIRVQTSLKELGFRFRLQDDFMNQHDLARITPFFDTEDRPNFHDSAEETPLGELSFDREQWEHFIEELSDHSRQEARPAQLGWSTQKGWGLQEPVPYQSLDIRNAERILELMTLRIQRGVLPNEMVLGLKAEASSVDMEKQFQLSEAAAALEAATAVPFVFRVGEQNFWLDLNSDPEAFIVEGDQFYLNEERIKEFLMTIADESYMPSSEVRITDTEEIRYGAHKAVLEGEWQAGKEVHIGEMYQQLAEAIEAGAPEVPEGGELSEREILVTLHDIPATVYSEIDGIYYDLLGVGYSEYSLGNKPNRVHNIQTGLNRIDHSIVAPGETISFNNMTGTIDYEFKIGYAIFGHVSKPSLGGGICQVSTTFYRGLLETGVPITMRQNHSWDLSYYRAGGYGLDATIFPSVGLDVKAVNDHDSHMYFKSVINPETEEAFVYVYGKSDGRKVSLTPQQDIEPYYGAKTLKWTQTVERPDGYVEDREIVSRYRM